VSSLLHGFVKRNSARGLKGLIEKERSKWEGEIEKQAKGYCGCEIQFPAADTQRIKSERKEKFASREISKYYSRVTSGKPFRILLAPYKSLRGSKVVSYCLASICLMYHAKCTSARISRNFSLQSWENVGSRENFLHHNASNIANSKRQTWKERRNRRLYIYMYIYFVNLEGESFLKDFFMENPPLFWKIFIFIFLKAFDQEKFSVLVGIRNTEYRNELPDGSQQNLWKFIGIFLAYFPRYILMDPFGEFLVKFSMWAVNWTFRRASTTITMIKSLWRPNRSPSSHTSMENPGKQ